MRCDASSAAKKCLCLDLQQVEAFLSRTFKLACGYSFSDVVRFTVRGGELILQVRASGGGQATTKLEKTKEQFVGFLVADRGAWRDGDEVSSVLFVHNRLHVRIDIDRKHSVGATHRAGISDVVLESAVSTIMDMEDSVAAVDAVLRPVVAFLFWFCLH